MSARSFDDLPPMSPIREFAAQHNLGAGARDDLCELVVEMVTHVVATIEVDQTLEIIDPEGLDADDEGGDPVIH